ncbi:MAG: gliding motility protein GldL [Muribaculaceae bacterium]|nr:gliding motility protein GldL [Muribaculaceae bacterium]
MGKVQQYKSGISAFISSEKGQRFFNFAYSIGAAIVIWGALFKILHLPGGNTLLSIGMGTEVLMFVLTAFDRPPKEYNWEDVFPALRGEKGDDNDSQPVVAGAAAHMTHGAGTFAAGHTPAADLSTPSVGIGSVTQEYLDQLATITADMKQLHATTAALNQVSQTLLESYRAITENSAEISQSARGYVDQMQALDRNISGLNTIYELQLRSVSSQIDSIDRVNRGIKDIRDMYEKSASQSARYCEETEKMARYMQQLNNVYEKMLTAMTVNMYRPGMTPPDIDGVPVNGHHTKVEA